MESTLERPLKMKQEVEHDRVGEAAVKSAGCCSSSSSSGSGGGDSNSKAVTIALSKRFKRICVFCGSSSGNKDIFAAVALSLGNQLVKRKVNLVYGGGSIGLMGRVAQTVHNGGGHVIGVIPKALMGKEICGQTVGELIPVLNMHQRKAEMARLADAFIALPGGYGTLEELLEVITWSQLGIHEKPVGLLNVDGYYNSLLALFDKALEEGFLGLSARNIVVSAPTACELLDKMEAYTPLHDWTLPKLCWEDSKHGTHIYSGSSKCAADQG